MHLPSARSSQLYPWLAVLWLGLVVACFVGLIRYSLVPGKQGHPPARWPSASNVALDPTRPTLVLTLHPHCPCSRATVDELVEILSSAHGRCAAWVLFVRPTGLPDPWASTPMWTTVRSIPGVVALIDRDGVEAARFGAATSGQVALYDPTGSLVFSGGITGARGHAGENRGAQAVLEFVTRRRRTLPMVPVYGCPLENSGDSLETRKCPST